MKLAPELNARLVVRILPQVLPVPHALWVMPLGSLMPRVPPEARLNAPGPATILVPQLSVPLVVAVPETVNPCDKFTIDPELTITFLNPVARPLIFSGAEPLNATVAAPGLNVPLF